MLHDSLMDTFLGLDYGGQLGNRTLFALFLEEIGWHVLWHLHHPQTKEYTCSASCRMSLSRKDYICGNTQVISLLTAISHIPRVVSDHSSILA